MSSYKAVTDPVEQATAALCAAADQLRAALDVAADGALVDGTVVAFTIADRLTCTGIRGTDLALADGTCERIESLPTQTLLSLAASVTAGDARMLCTAAETLRGMPAVTALFAAGTLSWSQVRGVVCAARRLSGPQREILDATVAAVQARGGSDPDEVGDAIEACVERLRGDLSEKRADRVAERERVNLLGMLDGAGRLYAELDPVGYAEVIAALEAAADRPSAEIARATQRADALLRLCRDYTDRNATTADTNADARENGTAEAERTGPSDGAATAGDDRQGGPVDGDGMADDERRTGPADASSHDAAHGTRDGADGAAEQTAAGENDAAAGDAERDVTRVRLGGGPVDLDGHETDRQLHTATSTSQEGSKWTPGGCRPRVHATVDLDALCAGRDGAAGTLWLGIAGGRVTLTRTDASLLLCGCGTVPIVLGADGTPVAVGDAEADIPIRLRRTVIERDGGCRFPGCTAPPQWVDVHHAVWREHGGLTCQENLVALCRRDHRRIHQRGWQVTLDPDGTMRFRRGRRTWTTRPRPSPSRDPRPPDMRGRPARPVAAVMADELPPLDPLTGERLPF